MQVIGWVPVEDPVRQRAVRRDARALRWRRLVRRHRRLAAALLLAVAAGLTVDALRPPEAVTTPVLAAAEDLPAGHRLQSSDVFALRLPPGAVPASAVAPARWDELAGEVLAAPVGQGELVTATRTVGAGLLDSAPPGTLAVPVALDTPMPDGAVRAGDVVAVLAGGLADPYATGLDDGLGLGGEAGRDGGRDGAAGEVLVTAATVLVAPSSGDGLLTSDGSGSDVALLALSTEEAETVAGAAGTRALTLALRPPGARTPGTAAPVGDRR